MIVRLLSADAIANPWEKSAFFSEEYPTHVPFFLEIGPKVGDIWIEGSDSYTSDTIMKRELCAVGWCAWVQWCAHTQITHPDGSIHDARTTIPTPPPPPPQNNPHQTPTIHEAVSCDVLGRESNIACTEKPI